MIPDPHAPQRLQRFVAYQASELQAAYRKDASDAVAVLAKLRRGVGKAPTDDVTIFGLVIEPFLPRRPRAAASESAEREGTPSLYASYKDLPDEPTDVERSAFAALTLFALHQQSKRDEGMHRQHYSFGRSSRLLGRSTNAPDAVRTRFSALATATTWDETVHHARGLIQQFRQHTVHLDYGQFARDLLELRSAATADAVRARWGRDFYRIRHPKDDDGPADDATTTDETN
jgi:CRISPR system Cascade subunit CasB